ncbi:hypothetical protein CsSME_00019333 [Camellia sinensis var. sinensis]
METGPFIRRTLMVVLFCMWVPMKVISRTGNASASSSKLSVVNIRALYTFNSVIGRSAKPAIEVAVDDVNSDSTVLAGMKLNLILHDTNCSGFLGIMEALQLMENDVVAVIDPQSSRIAHVISHVVNELHVLLMSFAATDPTLSALQFPYFLRNTYNDYLQIRNGISVLGDALAKKHAEISYKAAFTRRASRKMTSKLPRMLTAGYTWIATDWVPSVLDSSKSIDPNTMNLLQGIIALHHHTPYSDLKKSFTVTTPFRP